MANKPFPFDVCKDCCNTSGGGTVSPEDIKEAVNEYLEENPVESTPIDETLTKQGEAADAKVTGDRLSNIELSAKYYGDASIMPSPSTWFRYSTTSPTSTDVIITGLSDAYTTEATTDELKHIVIPYEINGAKVVSIRYQAFAYSNITGVVIPSTVTSVDTAAFQGCSKLKSVVWSPNVTTINTGVFYGCNVLSEFVIPKEVTNLYEQVFSSCTLLSKVYFNSNVQFLDHGIPCFEDCPNVTIYCSQGSEAEVHAEKHNIPVVYTEIKQEYLGDIDEALENIIALQREKMGGESA